MQKLSTVIIEDETMFRQLVVTTLSKIKDLRVVAEFATGKPALEFCLEKKPDMVVIDLVLPDMDGLDIARRLQAERPKTIMLVITAHPSERLPAELMQLGVNGYIDKTEPIDYLISAIGTIRQGGMFFATHVGAKRNTAFGFGSPPPPLKIPLTEREKEVARMVAAGRISKEIAGTLNLSRRTVEKHRQNILKKIGARDVVGLTRWCLQGGISDP